MERDAMPTSSSNLEVQSFWAMSLHKKSPRVEGYVFSTPDLEGVWWNNQKAIASSYDDNLVFLWFIDFLQLFALANLVLTSDIH